MKIILNIIRFLLSLTFIFSGFVKAVDPLGTQYKFQDYMLAMGIGSADGFIFNWGTLIGAVLLAGFEFSMGIFLLFAMRRRLATLLILLFMLVMTAITIWIYVADPVSDCGCFGDAIKLTNGETLLKNIVLLACSIVLATRPLQMPRLISQTNQWIVANYSYIFVLVISMYALINLPMLDFRPYNIGANIPEGMIIPEGAKQPQFLTTLIYEKDGVKKEFDMENIPDSTWKFVDSKTILLSKGYEPPIHDFSINLLDIKVNESSEKMQVAQEDITDEVLEDTNYTFLLVAPHLETADDTQFGKINLIADYAQRNGYRFICLTASNPPAILSWMNMTGAEYQFANTDEITLKTIVRSSPGLILLKDGTVYQKWSHNFMPRLEEDTPPIEQTEYAELSPKAKYKDTLKAVLWYAIPLIILSILDRLFAWSRYLRRRKNSADKYRREYNL